MNMFGIAGFPVPGRAFMAFAAAASVAVSASAATTYTITTTAGDTYESPLAIDSATVSVDDGNGAVDMSFADAKATFSAGAVFRKRGPGYLRGSPSMFTFTGAAGSISCQDSAPSAAPEFFSGAAIVISKNLAVRTFAPFPSALF